MKPVKKAANAVMGEALPKIEPILILRSELKKGEMAEMFCQTLTDSSLMKWIGVSMDCLISRKEKTKISKREGEAIEYLVIVSSYFMPQLIECKGEKNKTLAFAKNDIDTLIQDSKGTMRNLLTIGTAFLNMLPEMMWTKEARDDYFNVLSALVGLTNWAEAYECALSQERALKTN